MKDIPDSIIKTMDYKTRMKNYQEELTEKLQTMGRLPLAEYDKVIRELVKKWKV